MSKLITSTLKAGIESLPDDFVQSAKSIPGTLKKKGVKDEELQFAKLGLPSEGKVTKQQLVEAESKRQDSFDVNEKGLYDEQYNWVSLEAGKDNPTYRENIYTFEQVSPRDPNRRPDYTSEHFPEDTGYMMHTRTYDDFIENKQTRVVQEIQSDLHQQGRHQGYGSSKGIDIDEDSAWEMTEHFEVLFGKIRNEVKPLEPEVNTPMIQRELFRIRFAEEVRKQFPQVPEEMAQQLATKDSPHQWANILQTGGVVPDTPYKNSWLRKGLEREFAAALENGSEQLAIPIKGGGVSNLNRSSKIQNWYETQVLNTTKKLAKQQGLDFKVSKSNLEPFRDNELEMLKTYKANAEAGELNHPEDIRALVNLMDSKGLPLSLDSVNKVLNSTHSNYRFTTEDVNEVANMFRQDVREFGVEGATERTVQDLQDRLGSETFQDYEGLIAAIRGDTSVADINRMLGHVPSGVEYAVIDLTKAAGKPPKSLALYSSPAAAVTAGYTAFKAGYNEDQVSTHLESQGYDEAEIAEIMADVAKMQDAVNMGYSEEEVQGHLAKQEDVIVDKTSEATAPIEPDTKSVWDRTDALMGYYEPTEAKQEAVRAVIGEGDLTAQELLAKLQVIQPNMASVTTRTMGFFGSREDARIAAQTEQASAQRIVNLASERGINLEWSEGKFKVQTDQGLIDVTPGVLDSMWEEKGELAGAITGGIAGFKAAPDNPWAKALGTVIGSVTGAVVGTEADYVNNLIQLQEDFSGQVAAHKALTAAEADVIGNVLGFGVVKSLGAGWRGIVRAKDFILDGNTKGAYQALKETTFVTDDQAAEIVTKLQRQTKTIQGNVEEQRIVATALTEPGVEDLVKASSMIDPQASRAVAKAINDRAQDVLKTSNELTNDNVGKLVTEDLMNYTLDVKAFYSGVKQQIATSPRINMFRFNYDKLAIEPVLEKLQANITSKTILDNFLLQAQKIRSMSDSRTIVDLIELSQFINDFKFNKKISSAKDFNVLNEMLGSIDRAIKQGAKVVARDPDKWLADFASAKAEYAKMKSLEKNVMAKVLNRAGINENVATKAFAKYITSSDGTFQEVMEKLPIKARENVEGSVLDTLVTKYAAGMPGGNRAINFPMVAKELEQINFTTPEARKMKSALIELGEVFKNDVPLSQATGQIQIPKFQSYLTADPIVRAKFELASGMFNYIKRLAPGQSQRNLALVKKTANLLEKPLNSKAIKELMDEVAGDANLTKQVLDVQKQAALDAAKGADKTNPKVKFYGKGKVLSPTGSGDATEIPLHRIATQQVMKDIANSEGIRVQNTKALDFALKQRGYMVAQQGTDKVRIIK